MLFFPGCPAEMNAVVPQILKSDVLTNVFLNCRWTAAQEERLYSLSWFLNLEKGCSLRKRPTVEEAVSIKTVVTQVKFHFCPDNLTGRLSPTRLLENKVLFV